MWVTKLAWVEVVLRCDGKLTMVLCKVCVMRLKVGKIFWCISLTTCKNMHVGKNARLHTLDVLWATISC